MKEYNNELIKLGCNIRKWRVLKDIKQHELAQKVFKDKSWLSLVENGKIDISYTQVLVIANALDLKPALLFEELPGNTPLFPVENKTLMPENNFQDITGLMKEILLSIKEQRL